ncbi:uncharacterized protein CDAR_4511 [Caerostris darwini]|uniref:Uncharacterized protein n=1 Tax=Caerostris darwini TaxID=1538125 RepID=A0AAV4SP32_9ARAC|nr:uncharacterized protein CDAR_4511 [Caerostris darwini]
MDDSLHCDGSSAPSDRASSTLDTITDTTTEGGGAGLGCSPNLLDSALPSDSDHTFDHHSSEEELEVINCGTIAKYPEKRKWSQANTRLSLGSGSSDEEPVAVATPEAVPRLHDHPTPRAVLCVAQEETSTHTPCHRNQYKSRRASTVFGLRKNAAESKKKVFSSLSHSWKIVHLIRECLEHTTCVDFESVYPQVIFTDYALKNYFWNKLNQE